MTEKTPASRPALRRSVDATVHPALAGRAPASLSAPRAPSPATASAEPDAKPAAPRKPLGKAKRAATSDVLRPRKKDPAVTVTVTVPKSLRKQLRAVAKARGIDAETLAAAFIAEGLQDS